MKVLSVFCFIGLIAYSAASLSIETYPKPLCLCATGTGIGLKVGLNPCAKMIPMPIVKPFPVTCQKPIISAPTCHYPSPCKTIPCQSSHCQTCAPVPVPVPQPCYKPQYIQAQECQCKETPNFWEKPSCSCGSCSSCQSCQQ